MHMTILIQELQEKNREKIQLKYLSRFEDTTIAKVRTLTALFFG